MVLRPLIRSRRLACLTFEAAQIHGQMKLPKRMIAVFRYDGCRDLVLVRPLSVRGAGSGEGGDGKRRSIR